MTLSITTPEGTARLRFDPPMVPTAQAIARQMREAGVYEAGAVGRLVAAFFELRAVGITIMVEDDDEEGRQGTN